MCELAGTISIRRVELEGCGSSTRF